VKSYGNCGSRKYMEIRTQRAIPVVCDGSDSKVNDLFLIQFFSEEMMKSLIKLIKTILNF
jgi:hypothetical protein